MVVFTTMSRLGRCARLAVRPAPTAAISTSAARSGGAWAYRALPPAPPHWCEYGSHAILTITWWWIFHGEQIDISHHWFFAFTCLIVIGCEWFGFVVENVVESCKAVTY